MIPAASGVGVAGPSVELSPPSRLPRTRLWRDRVGEFLCVGGVTPFLFPLSRMLRARFGLDASEYAVGFVFFYGAYLINDPHFAVTYLLFYKDARARAFGDAFGGAQRVRYVVAGVVIPLV